MLIPVFRLAAQNAMQTDAQRALIDANEVDAIARTIDAVEIHFLDEDMTAIGDDRATVTMVDVAYVAVMFHDVSGGLHADLGFVVVVDKDFDRDAYVDDDVEARAVAEPVDDALAVARAIADGCRAALRFERARLGLSVEHLS